jgi:2-polyprenyl-3-methyl-5-hydroxy-6-metoxy-1,4-benzoquinol methylase
MNPLTDPVVYALMQISTFGESRRVAMPTPERETYEQEYVEGARSRSRATLNPDGKSQYMNMGYWGDGAKTLDAAGEAMARLLGQAAGIRPGVRMLDVGCGCGDENLLWIDEFKPDEIVAIDINPKQIEAARERAAVKGITDRLRFSVGSAIEIRDELGKFDKVVSLEAAHGFLTREAFLREAFRMLAPGGTLAITDILPLPGQQPRHFALLPENSYSRDVLARKLAEAGYIHVAVASIREQVVPPFHRHLANLPGNRSLLGRIRMYQRLRVAAKLDYVLATAQKPNRS